MKEDSKEYKLWSEIVNDITILSMSVDSEGEDHILIIEKIEQLLNIREFSKLEKKAVAHLNTLENTWD